MRSLTIILTLLTALSALPAMAAQKVLIVLTSHSQLSNTGERTGFWLTELTHPYYVLKKQGFEIDLASIQGGPAPVDPRSLAENNADTATFLADTELMAKVYTTLPISEIDSQQYQAVLFSGGHGTMWDFADNQDINRIAADIYQHNGVVAAVCHGPAALTGITLNNGRALIEGKKVTGFTNEEEAMMKLTEVVPFLLQSRLDALATFIPAKAWSNHVVVDERLVTGQNPQSAEAVGESMAKLLSHN